MVPLRLRRVPGLEGRVNDTLFQPAALRPTSFTHAIPEQQTLVFFGGDVQDYPEMMAKHRDNVRYQQWNLERTARMLSQNFPYKHVLVVRPSRIEFQTLSCYDNFVESNEAGVPTHAPTHGALIHLQRLLEAVSSRLRSMSVSELLQALTSSSQDHDAQDILTDSQTPAGGIEASTSGTSEQSQAPEADGLWWHPSVSLERSQLTLVGFSKGCVVLNQLAHEFHYTESLSPADTDMTRFISLIEAMYWLDGGHAGGKHTWITQRNALHTLAHTGMSIYVHVSPYQVQDKLRPWIAREEKTFTAYLTKLGARVSRYLHESPEPHSLDTHFSVLGNFKRVQDSAPAHPP